MPAVVVVRARSSVIGSKRMVNAKVTVAASGDTWVVPGIKVIDAVQTTPATAIAAGVTFSGNTVTFLSAASNPTEVSVVGV